MVSRLKRLVEGGNLRLTGPKQARWSNTTVQKRSLSEDIRRRASEPILLAGLADTFDTAESPALNTDNYKAGDRGGSGLSEEHDPRRDLHVVTKFQVTGEVEGLFRHDGSVDLEDHNSDRLSGNDVTGNELGEDVESQLLVGNRKEDAEGEDEDQGEDDGEDESPERHLRIVHLDGNRSEDEGNGENDGEPPVGDIAVAGHEAGVNILLVFDLCAELLHNVTSVPQVGVGDNGGESGEAQTIVDDKRRGEEDGRVGAVLLHIEETVRDDFEGVEWETGVRVSLRGGNREVGGVPCVREVDDWDDEPEPEQERNHGVYLGPPLEKQSEMGSRKWIGCNLRGRPRDFPCTKSLPSRR